MENIHELRAYLLSASDALRRACEATGYDAVGEIRRQELIVMQDKLHTLMQPINREVGIGR